VIRSAVRYAAAGRGAGSRRLAAFEAHDGRWDLATDIVFMNLGAKIPLGPRSGRSAWWTAWSGPASWHPSPAGGDRRPGRHRRLRVRLHLAGAHKVWSMVSQGPHLGVQVAG